MVWLNRSLYQWLLGVRDALHVEVVLVQVGGHKLLGDGTEETLACEIGPEGVRMREARSGRGIVKREQVR